MSSTNSRTTNLPKLTDPEAASAMFDAVRTVAEQSFFAVAEPADDRSFGVAAAQVPRWLVATVGFEQGPLAGSVSCTHPGEARAAGSSTRSPAAIPESPRRSQR